MESQREPRLIGYKKKVDPPPPLTLRHPSLKTVARWRHVSTYVFTAYVQSDVWYVYNMHAH